MGVGLADIVARTAHVTLMGRAAIRTGTTEDIMTRGVGTAAPWAIGGDRGAIVVIRLITAGCRAAAGNKLAVAEPDRSRLERNHHIRWWRDSDIAAFGLAVTPRSVQSAPFVVRVKLHDDSFARSLPAGSVGDAAIFTDRIKPAHIIRKVLLRQIAITNYVNPF